MAFRFKGGINFESYKERTLASAIEKAPSPKEVTIPLLQHSGPTCSPTVSVGDFVKMGQIIGDSADYNSVPVHASVSGEVTSIQESTLLLGPMITSVTIRNDMNDTPDPTFVPYEGKISDLSNNQILEMSRKCGLVEMEGIPYPLHVKLAEALENKVDNLIINGAECEPFMTADHRTMVKYPREILGGIQIVMKMLKLKSAIIGINMQKEDAIATMMTTCEGSGIRIEVLSSKYPQGAPRQIIKSVTGRELPPGKRPVDIGCLILNVNTCAALYRAVVKGVPLIRRIVTVSGNAVKSPKNVLARIGTSFYDLFEYCDGFILNPDKIISGGPMTGTTVDSVDFPVVKNTKALLALSGKEFDSSGSNRYCIRCGKCIKACPMKLHPIQIYNAVQKEDIKECKRLFAQDCIQCGCCSYICPGKLDLAEAIERAKKAISD